MVSPAIFLAQVVGVPGSSPVPEGSEDALDFEKTVQADVALRRVLEEGETVTASKYPVAANKVYAELKALGYNGNTDIDNVASFQRLIGIPSQEANGQLIGQKTLKALVVASKAGKDWKKAVVSFAFPLAPALTAGNKAQATALLKSLDTPNTRKYIYDTEDGSQVPNRGRSYNLAYGSSSSLFAQDVIAAYKLLGLMPDNDVIIANYRFQILSGANTDPAKKKLVGAGTYNALKNALKAVSEGRPWRSN